MNQPPLNLPPAGLKLRREENIVKVFDKLRGKYVALTPEEYVRQHFCFWLTGELGYPQSMVSNEVSIKLNDTRRRCDTVVFRPDGSPFMIVEYKAPTVAVTQEVFDQIVRYNMALRSRFLTVSNGLCHYCCEIDYEKDTYRFLPSLPKYRP